MRRRRMLLQSPGGQEDTPLDPDQKQKLDALLNQFEDTLGKISLQHHVINTKGSPPLKMASYCLAPTWKDQLKAEVKYFATAGISVSPWSSPFIPGGRPSQTV
jgi:hypothetical protein